MKKTLKEYYLGKAIIEFCPLPELDIPKEGTSLGDFPLHWKKLEQVRSFGVECQMDVECSICKMFRPKTKWQKLKSLKFWRYLCPKK